MINDLYQETILDHNRRPRNFQLLEDANRKAEGYNPLCGDRCKVFLKEHDGVIDKVTFQGAGCAISTASASLMTEVLKGKTLEEARQLFAQFHATVTGGTTEELPEALKEDAERLEPLTGVKAYPVRVKCATLPWHAFEAALKSGLAGAIVKTE